MTLSDYKAEALKELETSDIVDAAATLLACIRMANEEPDDPDLPAGLTQIERITTAFVAFLQARPDGGSRFDHAPFLRLQSSILDIKNGKLPDLFRPVIKKAGHPGTGVRQAQIQGLAARTMSELVDGGQDTTTAANRVAASLRKSGSSDYKNIKSETVKKWREHLMEGPGAGSPREALDFFQMPIPELGNITSKQRGEELLRLLTKNIRNLG